MLKTLEEELNQEGEEEEEEGGGGYVIVNCTLPSDYATPTTVCTTLLAIGASCQLTII